MEQTGTSRSCLRRPLIRGPSGGWFAGGDLVTSRRIPRGPEQLARAADPDGPGGKAGAVSASGFAAEAAAAGEIVVLSISPRAYSAVTVQPLARMLRFLTETIASALAHDPTTTSRE